MYKIIQTLIILFVITIIVSVFLNIKYEKNLKKDLIKKEIIAIEENIIVKENEIENKTEANIENEKEIVEKYINDNINTLSVEKPVLGGNWHIISMEIDEFQKIAKIIFEDGHIQNKATLKYSITDNQISITNFQKN